MGAHDGATGAMDGLPLFGLVTAVAMLTCCTLEDQSAWFILAFAGCMWLGLNLRLNQVHGRFLLWKQSGPEEQNKDGASANPNGPGSGAVRPPTPVTRPLLVGSPRWCPAAPD